VTAHPLLQLLAAHPDLPADLSTSGLDSGFVETAARHGVPALVRSQLERGKVQLAPEVASSLHQQALYAGAHAQRVKALLLRVLDAFQDAQVQGVPLKGPFLAARLYEDPSHRFTSDVDVLVPEAQLPQAERALVALGLRRAPGAQEVVHRREHHHLTFSQDSSTVELHFGLSRAFETSFDVPALLQEAREARFEGRKVWVFSPEDELLYLAVHATQSALSRLSWLMDLKRLIAKQPPNWSRVLSRARRFNCEVPAYVALAAAHDWLKAEIPDEVLSAFTPPPLRRNALNQVFSQQRVLAEWDPSKTVIPTAGLILASTTWNGATQYALKLGRQALRRKLAAHFTAALPVTWRI